MQQNENLCKKLGQHIKKLRVQKNISLNEFSFSNDLTSSTLSRIENGLVDPKYTTLVKIASAFGIEPHELLKFN